MGFRPFEMSPSEGYRALGDHFTVMEVPYIWMISDGSHLVLHPESVYQVSRYPVSFSTLRVEQNYTK